jgi:hypothetical protein
MILLIRLSPSLSLVCEHDVSSNPTQSFQSFSDVMTGSCKDKKGLYKRGQSFFRASTKCFTKCLFISPDLDRCNDRVLQGQKGSSTAIV